MKPKSKMKEKPQAEINTVLYAVAPQPKLSTDAIALDGAVVSRGNGIGATSEVYLMDCIVGMKHYPDKYFDLAVVDPPYGIDDKLNRSSYGSLKGGALSKYSDKRWDISPKEEYFTELFRVSKNQIIWGGNYFTNYLRASRCWICWNKAAVVNNFSSIELAWTSFDYLPNYFYYAWSGLSDGILGRNKKEKSIHPTQKPIDLYFWIYKNYTFPYFKILDTHLGSGSSRIAAHQSSLSFTGFEIDDEYYYAQKKRFKEYQSQLNLFNNG